MLPVWSLLVQCLQVSVLIPSFVLHPLPHLGGHLVEADVQGWEGRGLVERCRAGEVVPSSTEGKPQGAVLHFLQSADGCVGECMHRDRRVSEKR